MSNKIKNFAGKLLNFCNPGVKVGNAGYGPGLLATFSSVGGAVDGFPIAIVLVNINRPFPSTGILRALCSSGNCVPIPSESCLLSTISHPFEPTMSGTPQEYSDGEDIAQMLFSLSVKECRVISRIFRNFRIFAIFEPPQTRETRISEMSVSGTRKPHGDRDGRCSFLPSHPRSRQHGSACTVHHRRHHRINLRHIREWRLRVWVRR